MDGPLKRGGKNDRDIDPKNKHDSSMSLSGRSYCVSTHILKANNASPFPKTPYASLDTVQ